MAHSLAGMPPHQREPPGRAAGAGCLQRLVRGLQRLSGRDGQNRRGQRQPPRGWPFLLDAPSAVASGRCLRKLGSGLLPPNVRDGRKSKAKLDRPAHSGNLHRNGEVVRGRSVLRLAQKWRKQPAGVGRGSRRADNPVSNGEADHISANLAPDLSRAWAKARHRDVAPKETPRVRVCDATAGDAGWIRKVHPPRLERGTF